MKKQNRLELVMLLAYVLVVVLCYGVYLRFGKGYSASQAFQTVVLDVGNFLVVLVFGLVVGVSCLFISHKLSARKRK
jgi:hypothetical protein